MEDIVRTTDERRYGLYVRTVLGLNLFSANGIKMPTADDPRVVFLRTLAAHAPCSANLGSVGMRDLVDSPEDLLESSGDAYFCTRVGLMEGTFYASSVEDCSCFLPLVTEAFCKINAPEHTDGYGIQYLIEGGALALYVGYSPETSPAVERLLSEPPDDLYVRLYPPQQAWLQALAKYYKLVIVAEQDGMYFSVYATDEAHFSLLTPAIENATNSVKESSWYQQHEKTLQWDSKSELCLMLPKT